MSKRENNTKYEKNAKQVGIGLTIAVHVVLLISLFGTGFKTIYPPPAEKGIIVEYENKSLQQIKVKTGNEPKAENPDPKKEVRLVQKSESAIKGKKANTSAESTMGDKGDIARYEPKREKPINKRALFPGADNRDSSDLHVAKRVSESLKAGHSEGNTVTGKTDGEPSARLAGRSLMGNLPEPEYNVNKSGRVVVKIMVDQYGDVVNAIPGASGTTVQDRTLWDAAKRAALKAKFNVSSSAPVVQEGTITYIFRLR